MTINDPSGARRVWGPVRIGALLLASIALAAGLSLVSARAYAAFVPVTGAQGPHLQLQSDPFPAEFLDMSPGSVEHWQIAASLVDPTATLNVQYAREGGLIDQPVDGLQLQVQACDAEWTDVATTPACSDSPQNVFGPAAANTLPVGATTDLNGITNAKGKYLLVTMSIADTPEARADKTLQGLTGTIGFGLTATDATAVTPPSTPPSAVPAAPSASTSLAFTGADILPLLLIALGAFGLGAVLITARRLRTITANSKLGERKAS